VKRRRPPALSSPRSNIPSLKSLETARAIEHPAEIVQHWIDANSTHIMDYLRSLCRGIVKRITSITP
jgi:hypothetical protein